MDQIKSSATASC